MMRRGETTLRTLLAPIDRQLSDPTVTELVINQPGEIGVEYRGRWEWFNVPELTFKRLDSIAILSAAMSRQDVGPSTPICSTTLPDGQRVQVCRPPVTRAGTISLTIRRPSDFKPTLETLAGGGTFNNTAAGARKANPADEELLALYEAKNWAAFFPLAVRAKKTIIVSGDTGSGKTTIAKAFIEEIPRDERLITIEDTAEFTGLPQRNVVGLFYSKGDQGIAKVQAEDLIAAALRMRPDRVLMQELRDSAAFAFMRGVAAGHPGSITTCHAGSALGAFDALRLMVKEHESGRHLADTDVSSLLRQSIDVIVHCERHQAGTRGVSEVYFAASARRAPQPIAA